jgi:unsaturated rhamnogalacturonyl hydrolase
MVNPYLKHAALALMLCAGFSGAVVAQKKPLTIEAADAAMARWPDGRMGPQGASVPWGFEPGILLSGVRAVSDTTHDPKYFAYLKNAIDQWVQEDGSIRSYDMKAYALNNILLGRELLLLYSTTHEEKYRKAAETLHAQLLSQPENPAGGWWHAQATPNLMLMDDEYMLGPFYAEYAKEFREPKALAAVKKQIFLVSRHATDAKTGLLHHGWDTSTRMGWKDGLSPSLWSRSMGWYLMALVDTLQYVPGNDPDRPRLLALLRKTAHAVELARDPQTGLWFQIMDKPALAENYIESSSCLMLTYALAKGARLGYLAPAYHADAEKAWQSILKRFVKMDQQGQIMITGTVTHVSLGAAVENDGRPDYYLHAPVVSDDAKGVGAFLLAGSEMELQKAH